MTPSTVPTRGAVIVLNWRNSAETIRCLEYLEPLSDPVLVIDNGSGDGSVEHLSAYIANLSGGHLLVLERNFGFAGGMNRGIEYAAQVLGADAVLLLNNDARCPPATAARLLSYAMETDGLGLVTGVVLFAPDDDRVWFAGGYLDKWRGQAVVPEFKRRWSEVPPRSDPQVSEFVSLAAAAFRVDTFERVGPLDEDFFFGYEEWDYSKRCIDAELKNQYLPSCVLYHSGDGSHDNFAPTYIYNSYRNKLTYQVKHLGRLFAPWLCIFCLYSAIWLPKRITRLNGARVRTADVRHAVAWAIMDFFRLGRRVTEDQLSSYQRRISPR